MTDDEKEALNQSLDALERLMNIFKVDHILYLIVAFMSFLLFVYASILLFREHQLTDATLNLVLGGSGLATVASSRIHFFLNRAFKIIEEIIRKFAGLS
jgi:hypothetical protein